MLTLLRSHVGLALVILPWLAAPARAQCPDWQAGFQAPGTDGFVNGLTMWNDGGGDALFVLGSFSHAGTTETHGIARFDGTSFTALGSGLALASGLPGKGNAAVLFDDGSGPALYVGGNFASADGIASANIARWDGSSWSAVGAGVGNGSFGDVRALAVFDDGTGPALYAGGSFATAGGNTAANIAKWNGSVWSPVGSGTSSWVNALTVYDSGSGPALYVGGNFTSAGGVTAYSIAKWDGTSYSPLGPGLIGSGDSDAVYALQVFDDGTGPDLYVGGDFVPFDPAPGEAIARWNGTTWSHVGVGTFGRVRALAVHDSGSGPEMYAGGIFGFFDNAHSPGIARWSNGAWSSVGTSVGTVGIQALASYDSGTGAQLYAGGPFTTSDGNGASYLSRWNGAHWSSFPGQGLNGGPQGFGPNAVRAIARYDAGNGPRVVVAGGFAVAGPTPAHDVALWDGTSWTALGHGLDDGSIETLCVFEDGQGYDLYAGGSFITTNGVLCVRIARWNGSGWANIGSGMNDVVHSMTVFDDGTGRALYVSGNFSSANGLAVTGMARWNGTNFTAISGGLNARAMTVFDDGSGAALFAGGDFVVPGGPVRIARRDGSTWSSLGTGLNGTCYALTEFDDGTGPALYAAGAFTVAGGVSANHIARWKDGAWSALGGGTDATIFTLDAYDDGSGPALYAGGDFSNAGGLPAAHVARWNGSRWSALSSGTDATVYALAGCDIGGGPRLMVGGNFGTAGGVAASRISAWEGCGPATAGISFCAGDGTATACPCGNVGAPGNGCANSVFAGGAHMSAEGIASLSSDDVVLHGDGMPGTGAATYFQGTTSVNGGAGIVFGDGLRCAGGSLVRLRTTFNVNGASQYPAAGDASISARGAVRVPGERTYQCSYRNAGNFCTPSTFNLTNGQRILWSP